MPRKKPPVEEFTGKRGPKSTFKSERAPVKLKPMQGTALKIKKVTPRQLPAYIEKIMALAAPYIIPDAMEALREGVASRDSRAVEHTLKAYGIHKAAGISVTQVNQNTGAVESSSGFRSFEAFIRESALKRGEASVVGAPQKVIECLPLSAENSPLSPDGSEIPE